MLIYDCLFLGVCFLLDYLCFSEIHELSHIVFARLFGINATRKSKNTTRLGGAIDRFYKIALVLISPLIVTSVLIILIAWPFGISWWVVIIAIIIFNLGSRGDILYILLFWKLYRNSKWTSVEQHFDLNKYITPMNIKDVKSIYNEVINDCGIGDYNEV
jgi:hypothetical protein